MNAMTKAIELAGSQSQLAKMIGVSSQVIDMSKKRDKVSIRNALFIEAAFPRDIRAEEFCPEIATAMTVIRNQPPEAR